MRSERSAFRAFPTMPLNGLVISLESTERRIRLLLSGIFGPLNDEQRQAFTAAATELEHVRAVLVESMGVIWSDEPRSRDNGHPSLTATQLSILRLIARGKNNDEIARQLSYSVGTIKLHIRELLQRLGATDRTEAAVIAAKRGLI